MAGAKLEKTRWPGIYRRGDKYVFEWTDAQGRTPGRGTGPHPRGRVGPQGAPKKPMHREAISARSVAANAHGRSPPTRSSCSARRWTPVPVRMKRGRYAGRRGGNPRQHAWRTTAGDIERYWLPGAREEGAWEGGLRPTFLAILAALAARGTAMPTSPTARYAAIFAPVGALLATAAEEGVIAHNPARDVRIPTGRDALQKVDRRRAGRRRRVRSPGGRAGDPASSWRAFLLVVEAAVAVVLRVCSPALVCRVGPRRSRSAGATSYSMVRGPSCGFDARTFAASYGPPKSRHGRRDVPIGGSNWCGPFAGPATRSRSGHSTAGPRLPDTHRHGDGRRQPPPPCPQTCRGGGRHRLGRVSHLSPCLCIDADRRRPQHRAGLALAWAPFAEAFTLDVYAQPDGRRRGRARSSCGRTSSSQPPMTVVTSLEEEMRQALGWIAYIALVIVPLPAIDSDEFSANTIRRSILFIAPGSPTYSRTARAGERASQPGRSTCLPVDRNLHGN